MSSICTSLLHLNLCKQKNHMPDIPVKKIIDVHERVRNAARNNLQVITKALIWRKQKYCHMSEESHKRTAMENVKATFTVKVKQSKTKMPGFGKKQWK